MTKQKPFGRYAVYSLDSYQNNYPNAVPAARYDDRIEAEKHADSVTYKMCVIDMTAESRGYVHFNWNDQPKSSPWGQVQHAKWLAPGIWSVSTASHGGISLNEARLEELTKILGSEYPAFGGNTCWFEEDCDWVIPVIAFQLEHYEAACRQLRSMRSMGDKYVRACNALIAAGKMLDAEKIKQAVSRRDYPEYREPSCDACLGQ